ncbi:hypothetical protein Tco_0251485 [Tanacetum coccineum]
MYGHYEYGSQPLAALHLNLTLLVLYDDDDFTDMYSPQFSESFREEQSPVEEMEEIQVPTPRRSRIEDAERPRRRSLRTKKARTNVVTHGPLRKRLHCAKISSTVYAREWEKKNKRYKSSDSSSFNTRESREGSINLNTTIENEEDEVEEVCQSRPIGRDQAKRKAKVGSLAGSTSAFDVESLVKMMANGYVMASDLYNVQKSQKMSELLRIKNKELELKAAELKIRRLENRQKDKALYEMTTDEDLKAILRQMLFS